MPLVDGDPAPEGDVWYRILTSDKHITKGRIQHAAFQGRFIKAPTPSKNRPWNAEASGRLRSLAGSIADVRAHSTNYCAKLNQKFTGIMFPKEPLAGQTIESLEVGIFYTPIVGTDEAHSDLTFTGNVPFVERSAEHDRFVMALSSKFTALHPDQLDLLPEARVIPVPRTMLDWIKWALNKLLHR